MTFQPRLHRSGDPNTIVGQLSPREILQRYGMPAYLLGTSTKIDKSGSVGVLSKVLYLTPGTFCSAADISCLRACLGHHSGRMSQPDSYRARDKRTAMYLEHQGAFIDRLKADIYKLVAEARIQGRVPAVRLNGTSDLAWERRHRDIFEQFPGVRFYDYTKVFPRMMDYLGMRTPTKPWPKNYSLTYSAAPDEKLNRRVLDAGGNVAVVFATQPPSRWLDVPTLDGEKHDARFLDRPGTVVALKAKAIARVDITGFTRRPCPNCGPHKELDFRSATRGGGYIRTHHQCSECGEQVHAKQRDPYPDHMKETPTMKHEDSRSTFSVYRTRGYLDALDNGLPEPTWPDHYVKTAEVALETADEVLLAMNGAARLHETVHLEPGQESGFRLGDVLLTPEGSAHRLCAPGVWELCGGIERGHESARERDALDLPEHEDLEPADTWLAGTQAAFHEMDLDQELER